MMVFVNAEKETILIIKDGMAEEVSWENIDQIKILLNNEQVMYIESVIEVSGDDIVGLINDINNNDNIVDDNYNDDESDETDSGSSIQYVHSIRGQVNMTIGGSRVTFNNPLHFVPISDFGNKEALFADQVFSQAISKKKIEIISGSQRRKMISNFGSVNTQSPKDIVSESILIDRGTEDNLSAIPSQSIDRRIKSEKLEVLASHAEDIIADAILITEDDLQDEVIEEAFDNIKRMGLGRSEIDAG